MRTARLLGLAAWIVFGVSLAGLAQETPETGQPGVLVTSAPMFWVREITRTPGAILPAGAPVIVLKREGDWYRVVFHDPRFGDETGYVAVASIRIDPTRDTTLVAGGESMLTQRGFVEGQGWAFPQTASNDPTRLIGDVLFRDEVFLKPARWIQFSAGLDLRANSHDEVETQWRFDVEDRGVLRPKAALRRLTATVRKGGFTLDVGKQFIRWGRADIQNPTDRFAPRDFLNVLNTDLLPVLAAHPSLQMGTETVEAVWAPRFTPSRLPLFDQRWTVLPPEAAGFTVQDGGSSIPSGSEWGVRWSHASGHIESSLSYFDGYNHLPNLDVLVLPDVSAVELTRVYPRLRSYGADLAIPLPWFSLKGEAAYFTAPSSASDEYVLYVVEVERQTGEWLLDFGYIGDVMTRSSGAFSFAPDRGIARSVIGHASYTVDPRRSVALEGAVRQGGQGFYVKGEYSETWGQHWRLTLTGVGLAGQRDDFLGQYQRNSHAAAALRFSF
jgi:hypothetical protein